MTRVLRWIVAAGLLLGGCRDGLPPGWDADAAAAFQRSADEAMRGDVTPLTAVAAHYVGPGHRLRLGVRGHNAVVDPPADADPQVAVQMHGDTLSCSRGCPDHGEIDETVRVPLGSLLLEIGPQPGTGARVLVHDPQSNARASFTGLRWFPVDTSFIVPARLDPASRSETVQLTTSRGLTKPFERVGHLELSVAGSRYRLAAFAGVGAEAGRDGVLSVLVPFTDETTGDTTYSVGRYLEVEIGPDDKAVVDFNRATNPWCAYSPHYNCPIPPPQNALDVPIEAGEQAYHP